MIPAVPSLPPEAIDALVTDYRAHLAEIEAHPDPAPKRGPREKVERRRLVLNCFLALEAHGIQPSSHSKGNVAALAQVIHELATGTPRHGGWADHAMEVSAGLRAGQRLVDFVAERGAISLDDLEAFRAQEAERDIRRRKNFKNLNFPK